jgi:cell division protein FtsB
MIRSFPWAAAVLALACCGKPQDPAPATPAQAQADLARIQADKEALASELSKVKQELAMAKVGATAAPEETAKLRAERDALAAEVARLNKTPAADAAAGSARASALKERDAAAAEAARARATADDLARTADELRRKERDLAEKLSAATAENDRLKTSAAALERQARDAQGRADAATAALRSRLGYAGQESIPSHRALPIAWNAAAGETIRWSWTIDQAPLNLAADLLEFAIVAPDGTKAYATRAGHGKAADEGTFVATAGGRWTAVWQNRDPEKPFAIRFTVALEASPPRPAGGP